MKPVLLTFSIAALIAVAACNARTDNQIVAAPNESTGNMVAAPTPTATITAAQAYDIRHERYEDMGDSLKAINRELKGDAPDVARVQREAATLTTLAEQVPSWFPAGSGPDVHPKSRAKAEIWSDAEGFRRAHEGYAQQAQAFRRAADSGDVPQMRAAVQPLGKSCGNCHDDYRGPER